MILLFTCMTTGVKVNILGLVQMGFYFHFNGQAYTHSSLQSHSSY